MIMLARVLQITDLSFVQSKKNVWSPRRTGNYAQDAAYGRDCAEELLLYMRVKDDPLPYSQVARAISESGRFEAVEIGFCSRIGIHLLVGSERQCAASITDGVMENPWKTGTRAVEAVQPVQH
jgi:hypothetical protein